VHGVWVLLTLPSLKSTKKLRRLPVAALPNINPLSYNYRQFNTGRRNQQGAFLQNWEG
jgi:hypothetical protein